MALSLSVHSPLEGHVDYIQILAIMNRVFQSNSDQFLFLFPCAVLELILQTRAGLNLTEILLSAGIKGACHHNPALLVYAHFYFFGTNIQNQNQQLSSYIVLISSRGDTMIRCYCQGEASSLLLTPLCGKPLCNL